MKQQSTDIIIFRNHLYMRAYGQAGFGLSHALTSVKLLTQAEYNALKDEDKPRYRLIQRRDLNLLENKFGKADPELAARQAQAIIDAFPLRLKDESLAWTNGGFKSFMGLLFCVEGTIGRFDSFDPVADKNDEIETLQGQNLIHLLGLKVKDNGRVDMVGGDKTPLGLVRTLRRVVTETE